MVNRKIRIYFHISAIIALIFSIISLCLISKVPGPITLSVLVDFFYDNNKLYMYTFCTVVFSLILSAISILLGFIIVKDFISSKYKKDYSYNKVEIERPELSYIIIASLVFLGLIILYLFKYAIWLGIIPSVIFICVIGFLHTD